MRHFPATLLLLLAAAGCGSGDKVDLVPVSGSVTLDGNPLPDATVSFQPQATGLLQPGSFGKTDKDGRYSLEVVTTRQKGAVPGLHRVTITLQMPDQQDDSGQYQNPEGQLPARYNRETKLEFDVPASGSKAADFPLTSD